MSPAAQLAILHFFPFGNGSKLDYAKLPTSTTFLAVASLIALTFKLDSTFFHFSLHVLTLTSFPYRLVILLHANQAEADFLFLYHHIKSSKDTTPRHRKMAQPVSATIIGPNGPLDMVLGEQNPDQRFPCSELGVAAFAPQLPASVFAEHAEAMSKHPLAHNQGIRYWCISLADNPASVITMCGTIRRPLLVRDSESTREEDGYCVFMVATHAQYRRLGLAKMLMKRVAEWLDGPGNAAASMLYTSVGDVSGTTEL